MFGFRSCRWQKLWLFFFVVTLLLTLMWCYDPCPEHLRQTKAAKPCSISKSEIEKAFQDAGKIVDSKAKQEIRLVKEGKVVNRKIKSAKSTHQQAHVRPEVREREVPQRIFQEASAILIKKYRIPDDEVSCSLPKADLSSPSAARAVQSCANQDEIQCDSSSKYRTADGTCNNLNNRAWGSALTCFNRLLPAVYSDNETFRRSVIGGYPLTEPRILSLNIHFNQDRPTNYVTHLFMFFGQFLDHDITLTAASTTAENEAIECCPISSDSHPQCAPIPIYSNDPFYSRFNVTCLNFVRSALCDSCTLGARAQMNQVTAFIDASHSYGNSDNETNGLRDPNTRGNLRVQRSSVGELLPRSDPQNDQCSNASQNQFCFLSGDVRVNQHPALTSLHTIFHREHNRCATRLRAINPQWSEERIFQEARKIVGAQMQMITYDEYLPLTLGNDRMDYFNLWVNRRNQSTTYDPSIDPSLYTEFSTAAFRFGHSTINSLLAEIPNRQGHSGHQLRDTFFYPFDIYTGEIDPLMRGSTRSPAQYFDRYLVPDVTNYLYRIRGEATGLDLAAFNIQRGRDHGLERYVDVIRYCWREDINIQDFDELITYNLMSSENANVLRQNYRHVRDVDLFVGILLEYWNPGAVVGPTAACIIGSQFKKLKYGDRFYFEHKGVFTPEQLCEIKKVTLARIFCDNTGLQEIQRRAMTFNSSSNPIRACSYLPQMDLNAWKEK